MTTTRLNDLFDEMEPEEGNKIDDKIQVEKKRIDKQISQMFEDLYEFDKVIKIIDNQRESRYAQNYLKVLTSKKYSSNAITEFSLSLSDKVLNDLSLIQSGYFINKLIQKSDDYKHLIYTRHFDYKLHNIGSDNEKDITVHGDLASFAGTFMKSGILTVHGNVENYTGNNMIDGRINILGNSGEYTGKSMKGGEIHVSGQIEDYDDLDLFSGKIFENEKELKPKFQSKIYRNILRLKQEIKKELKKI